MIWAVHLSDGVLDPWWLLLAAGGMLLCIYRGARRIRDEEIPRIGLLGAAFFVASLIHVRLGPTSVHLLLNGLLGLVLGPRSALAISVGLLLQALLLGHGGVTALGVNGLVMIAPAFLSRPLWRRLRQGRASPLALWGAIALGTLLHPWGGVVAGAVQQLLRLAGRRLGSAAFWQGFTIGVASVTLTALLNSVALLLAGVEDWSWVAGITFLAHLPVAVLEGVILGFVVAFLQRVQPGLLPADDSP